MKAKDLRLDNIIYSKGLNDYRKVIGAMLCLSNETLNDLYKPIPLTEEILLKCGFEYFKSNNSFQLDTKYGFSICGRVDNGFYIYVESDEIGNAFCFLHQLQNLYFALTNEELTINL